jgi:hypothetical protein
MEGPDVNYGKILPQADQGKAIDVIEFLRRWLTAWAIIHFTSAHDRALDFGAAEMTGLAGAPVSVETVLLARRQALLLEPRDQGRRIDDATRAVGAPRQADDLASQFVQLRFAALAWFH